MGKLKVNDKGIVVDTEDLCNRRSKRVCKGFPRLWLRPHLRLKLRYLRVKKLLGNERLHCLKNACCVEV